MVLRGDPQKTGSFETLDNGTLRPGSHPWPNLQSCWTYQDVDTFTFLCCALGCTCTILDDLKFYCGIYVHAIDRYMPQ